MSLLRAGAAAGLAAAAACTAYLLGLLGAAALPARRPPAGVGGEVPPTVVLVPAHDEEASIAACVTSLRDQDVPAEALDIVVVADNCTDDTAAQARAAGATTWVRHAPRERGKGQALAWALARVEEERPGTAVVGVVDADCVASPGLVRAWAGALSTGACAVQADYVVANPEASAAAARRWAGFALMHAVRGAGKARLGLSSGLFGTGMAFEADQLRRTPWASFSVTEDIEHHVRIVESGGVVAFAGQASVASPAPLSQRDAEVQQLRWETGNAAVARQAVPRLLVEGLRRGDRQRLLLAVDRLVPAQSVLVALIASATLLAALARAPRLVLAGLGVLGGQVAYVLGGLALARAPRSVWLALLGAPLLVAARLRQVARIAAGRGARTWVRTAR